MSLRLSVLKASPQSGGAALRMVVTHIRVRPPDPYREVAVASPADSSGQEHRRARDRHLAQLHARTTRCRAADPPGAALLNKRRAPHASEPSHPKNHIPRHPRTAVSPRATSGSCSSRPHAVGSMPPPGRRPSQPRLCSSSLRVVVSTTKPSPDVPGFIASRRTPCGARRDRGNVGLKNREDCSTT